MEISNEEYILMKEVKENPLYPIAKHELFSTLKRKQLITRTHWTSDDGQRIIEGYKINPDKMWVYEKYEQSLKDNQRSEEHSLIEKKSYKLDVIALILSIIAIIASVIAIFF